MKLARLVVVGISFASFFAFDPAVDAQTTAPKTTLTATPVVPKLGPPAVASGPIGPSGGTVSLLHFGVFGDARPPSLNDSANYPNSILVSVFQGMASHSVQFALDTGNHLFANTQTSVNSQLTSWQTAESNLHAFTFHSMGNHDCTGKTTDNCPTGTESLASVALMTKLLSSTSSTPYYSFVVHTSLGDALFVVTAPNAWTTTQQTWLQGVLATKARYKVVVEHYPPSAPTQGPGSTTIVNMAHSAGATLVCYGFTAEYRHGTPSSDVTMALAGAPLATGNFYGYLIVDQQQNGSLTVTVYNTQNAVVDSWNLPVP